MTPSDLLVAVMLLSAPLGAAEVPPTPERWPAIRDSLRQTAIEWEILDARETSYVLTKLADYQDDLDFLRKRRAELAEAPHTIDSTRLPDKCTINECIRFNRAFQKNLETRLVWEADRAAFIVSVIGENERLYRIWDAIRDAKSDMHYVSTRRLALLRLRDMIGPEAFEDVQPPPYVPDWRFSHVP